MPIHNRFSNLDNEETGLVSWLEGTRVRLPLKAVDVRFEVACQFAKVEVDSVFHNSRDAPLDVSYAFPLPTNASVYRCEMISKNRTIAAIVESKAKALEEFQKAKAEGRRAALVEQVRENFFNLSLGNVQPKEVVLLRIAYIQETEKAVRTSSLRIPLNPCERYIPGKTLIRSNLGDGAADDTDEVPDASLLSPPRIDQLHPDAATLRIKGLFPDGFDILQTLHSPSHSIAIRSGKRLSVSLTDGEEAPDREFVLRWEAPSPTAGTARLLQATDGSTPYGILSITPPDTDSENARVSARTIRLLLDCSYSMNGQKWDSSCEALIQLVNRLSPEDRVDITLFDHEIHPFAEGALSPQQLLADPNFTNIKSRFYGGGTELLPAVKSVLARANKRRDPEQQECLVIITDGELANESAIRLELSQHGSDITVHVIGIGLNPNDSLLKPLATDHGGQCMILSPNESVSEAIELIILGSAQASIRNLHLPDHIKPIGKVASRMYPGVTYTIPVELSENAHGQQTLLSGSKTDEQTWTCAPSIVETNTELLRLTCIRKQISQLETTHDLTEAIHLARKHNILCEGTSFIAIDKSSHATIATQHFRQPNMFEDSNVIAMKRAISTDQLLAYRELQEIPPADPSDLIASMIRKLKLERDNWPIRLAALEPFEKFASNTLGTESHLARSWIHQVALLYFSITSAESKADPENNHLIHKLIVKSFGKAASLASDPEDQDQHELAVNFREETAAFIKMRKALDFEQSLDLELCEMRTLILKKITKNWRNRTLSH